MICRIRDEDSGSVSGKKGPDPDKQPYRGGRGVHDVLSYSVALKLAPKTDPRATISLTILSFALQLDPEHPDP
jgi:hypothetical protein